MLSGFSPPLSISHFAFLSDGFIHRQAAHAVTKMMLASLKLALSLCLKSRKVNVPFSRSFFFKNSLISSHWLHLSRVT